MIAVTIGVGRDADLAQQNAARARSSLGIPVHVVTDADYERSGVKSPFEFKFRLFDLLPQADRLLYFDADVFWIKPWANPGADVPRTHIGACLDYMPNAYQGQLTGQDATQCLNAGLMILTREHHVPMLRAAEACDLRWASHYWDQADINHVVARERYPVHWLHRRFNYMWGPLGGPMTGFPIVGAHAAGARGKQRKIAEIQRWDDTGGWQTDEPLEQRLTGTWWRPADSDEPSARFQFMPGGLVRPSALGFRHARWGHWWAVKPPYGGAGVMIEHRRKCLEVMHPQEDGSIRMGLRRFVPA